jgi:hypothetical protein
MNLRRNIAHSKRRVKLVLAAGEVGRGDHMSAIITAVLVVVRPNLHDMH